MRASLPRRLSFIFLSFCIFIAALVSKQFQYLITSHSRHCPLHSSPTPLSRLWLHHRLTFQNSSLNVSLLATDFPFPLLPHSSLHRLLTKASHQVCYPRPTLLNAADGSAHDEPSCRITPPRKDHPDLVLPSDLPRPLPLPLLTHTRQSTTTPELPDDILRLHPST